jgi:hypothetical protein
MASCESKAVKSKGRMFAMKYGDNCWITNLKTSAHLNGRHVSLYEWVEDAQRWKCLPVGWKSKEAYIGLRPRNLANEPPAVQQEQPREQHQEACMYSLPANEIASQLSRLMEKEGELRARATISNPAGRLRLVMCQRELLSAQRALFAMRGEAQLIQQVQLKIAEVDEELAVKQAAWDAAGNEAVGIWDDEDVFLDPEIKRWLEKRPRSRSATVARKPLATQTTLLDSLSATS